MEPREPKDADVRLRFERLEDRLARLGHVVLAAPSLEATHTPEQEARDGRLLIQAFEDAITRREELRRSPDLYEHGKNEAALLKADAALMAALRAPVGQQDGLTALCDDAGPLGFAARMIRRGELDGVRITLNVSEVAALARWLREPDYRHPSPVSPPAKSSDYANLRAIANEALANMEALVQRLAGAEYDALFVRPSDSDNPEPTVFAGEIWDVHPKSRTVSIKPDALPPELWNSGTAPIGARVTVFVSEVQPTSSAGGSE